MQNALHQYRLTHLLVHFSDRLQELILQAHQYPSNSLSVEFLDEIASTIGELRLVLIEHQFAFRSEDSVRKAVVEAEHLRQGVRSHTLIREQLIEAVTTLLVEVEQIVRQDKMAA